MSFFIPHSEMRGAAMRLTAAGSGFVIFLLSVSVIQSQNVWRVTYTPTEICALKGSTVDMRCTYEYPYTINGLNTSVVDTFWFVKMNGNEFVDLRTDPEYSGRVQFIGGNNDCTLRITDLRESDSAEYKFRFTTNAPSGRHTGSPGVTLSVTDLQVQVSRSEEYDYYNWAELKCHSRCPRPHDLHYIWYKNGQNIRGYTSIYYTDYIYTADNYSCAVEGYEDFPSSAVYAPKLPSVSVSPGEIVEGSSVTLTCSSDANPAAKYTWYKNNGNAPSQDPQLVFSSIQSSDSGEYYCTAVNELGRRTSEHFTINVKHAPKLPSVSVSPSDGEIMEGSSVTLTCSSDANPTAEYSWYKNNGNARSQDPQLVFSFIQSSDSGEYYCTAVNELGRTTSEHFAIDVKYAPKLPSVSASPSPEIVEGSSVTLTCSSDANPAATYSWYKKNGKTNLQSLSKEPQLVFSSIQSSDSGEYCCTAENKVGKTTSGYISINVKHAPKVPSLSVSPAQIVEGRSVTLTCSSDANPAASYSWYKKNGNTNHQYLSKKKQLVFSSIRSSASGEYYCTAENHLGRKASKHIPINVKYAPKHTSVSVSPSAEIVEGRSVTLTCSSDANPAAIYSWYKNYKELLNKGPQLVFSSIRSSDSGKYYCAAVNELRRMISEYISINVKYAPKLPSVSVKPSGEIVEGRSVTLTCSSDANPAATYSWYKENQKLPQVSKGSYYFASISSVDRGNYYCKSENQYGEMMSLSLSVNVQYAPKLPSVSVSPSAEITEGSSVTLTCSSDANPAAKYTWYKENEDSPKTSGPIFTITDFRTEHSGNYSCEAKNKRGSQKNTLHLTVVLGSGKLATAATITVVLLAVICLAVFLWIRKKRASKESSEAEERPDNREQGQPEEQADLQYASIHFSNNQADVDPLYFNIRPAGARKHTGQQEVTEYAAVKYNSANSALRSRGPETEADAAALYSTVNKTR